MRVAVPRETAPGERRVALVPETVSRLRDAGFEIRVERGAGAAAGFPDESYAEAGAELVERRPRSSPARMPSSASRRPRRRRSRRSQPGTVLVGFLQPLTDTEGIARLRERGVVAFAMESIPRITRAQAMDALSSQATVAGYKAVLLAADRVPEALSDADDGRRHDRAGARARHRRGRRRAAGDRDRPPARRRRLRLRRPTRREGAGREPRRVVPRSRRPRGGDRRRLRERAHAGAAGAAAGGARGADPRLRRRHHDRRRARPPGAEAHPGVRGRAHAAGLGHRRPRGGDRRQLRADRPGRGRRARRRHDRRDDEPSLADGVPREPALLAQRRRAAPAPGAERRARARLGGRDHGRRVRHAAGEGAA